MLMTGSQQYNQSFGFDSNSKRLPRVIKIVVHRGRGLSYNVLGATQNEKSMKWRLIFHGGAKKLASSIVDEPRGNPEWNCEVEITAKNPVDPIVIVVEDAKKRQVGQVILNLQSIPRRPIPELYETHLEEAKLTSTKKNSNPCGYIYYWIGTVDYWPEDIDLRASIYKTRSLRKSLSSIGSAIFRTGKNDKEDRASNISGMSKFKKLREKYRKPNRENSFVGSNLGSEFNVSRSHVAANLSRNSSVTSLSKDMGGWSTNPGSVLNTDGNRSYNPIGQEDSGSDVDTSPHHTAKLKSSTSTHNLDQSINYAHERDKNSGFLKRVKSKLSKSTQNLSEIGTKLKSHSTKLSLKLVPLVCCRPLTDQMNSKSSVVDSIPVSHGRSRQATGSLSRSGRQSISGSNPFGGDSETETDENESGNPFVNTQFTVADGQIPNQNPNKGPPSAFSAANSTTGSPFTIRNGMGPSQTPKVSSNGTHSHRLYTHNRMCSGTSDLFQLMNGGDVISPQPDNKWGLHPEEKIPTAKSTDEMNRHEMAQYIHSLEAANSKMREELIQLSHENEELGKQYDSTSSELKIVRDQLGALRVRLLKDNQTQYLEVETNGDDEAAKNNLSGSKNVGAKNGSLLGDSSSTPQASNPLRALANAKNEDHFNWW